MKHDRIPGWLYGQIIPATLPSPEKDDRDSEPTPDWAVLAFRPIIISGMVTCVAAGLVSLLEFVLQGWRGSHLIALTAVLMLEMLFVEQQLRARRLDMFQRWQIRLAEIGVILILLKPVSYLPRGLPAFLLDSRKWLRQPEQFLDADYWLGAMVLLLVWPLAIDLAGQLVELQNSANAQEHEAGLAALRERFAVGAVVLLLCVMLPHLDLSSLGLGLGLRPARTTALTWLPLVYVGLGLLLFGQARLTILQAGWEYDQVPVAPNLVRRWAGWGTLFVLGVTLVAFLMPASETLLGLYILLLMANLVVWIGQFMVFLLMLVFGLLLSPCLTLMRVQQSEPPVMPQLPMAEPPPAQTAGPLWLFYLRIAVFWVVIAVTAFLLLRFYWRQRREVGGWSIWQGFVKLAQALWAWLMGWRNRIALQLNRPRAAGEGPIELPEIEPGWWQVWRARTARERVRRFYLALVQRAAQAGHPRRADQTPSEYAAALRPHIADEENALDTLTSAFNEARYSRREFQSDEVSVLRRIWEKLQTALRKP